MVKDPTWKESQVCHSSSRRSGSGHICLCVSCAITVLGTHQCFSSQTKLMENSEGGSYLFVCLFQLSYSLVGNLV